MKRFLPLLAALAFGLAAGYLLRDSRGSRSVDIDCLYVDYITVTPPHGSPERIRIFRATHGSPPTVHDFAPPPAGDRWEILVNRGGETVHYVGAGVGD